MEWHQTTAGGRGLTAFPVPDITESPRGVRKMVRLYKRHLKHTQNAFNLIEGIGGKPVRLNVSLNCPY